MKNHKLFKTIKSSKLLILLTLLGGMALFLLSSKKSSPKPQFSRSLFGSAYSAEISGVMKTNLDVTNEGAKIEISRETSALSINIPLSKAKIFREKDNEIVYTVPEKVIEARYQLLTNGLKEEIVLNKNPNTNVFQSRMKLNNLIVKINSDGIPVFYNEKGEYQFHFFRPFIKDAKGNVSYGVRYRIIEKKEDIASPVPNPTPTPVANNGIKQLLGEIKPVTSSKQLVNNYILIVEIDQNWLADPKRVFPVVIDPTVVHDTATEFNAGTMNRIQNVGIGETAPSLETYYQELPADIYTVGLWHMNEASGTTVADSSGNGNDGTATGTTIVDGRFGKARSFNGSSDYIVVGTNNMPKASAPQTISVWYYVSSNPTTTQDLIALGNTSNASAVQIGFNSVNSNKLTVWQYGGTVLVSTNPPSAGAWHFVTYTFDGTIHRLYVDGVEVNNSTVTPQSAVPTGLNIGRWLGGTEYFSGFIDEVRISNIARTPEEIKADAQRRPYGVYTSDVIDLTQNVTAWNSLSWTEVGVGTGDGETLANSTGLVAQWNFNETSGTTATNNAGSCGSSCNGTLTNFANTSGQDVAAGSGWTSANRRWGAGALMFDGSNDYVSVTNNASLNIGSSFSAEVWVKTSTTGFMYIYRKLVSSAEDKSMAIDASGKALFYLYNTFGGTGLVSNKTVTDGQWHYIVATYDGSTAKIYIDGLLDNSKSASGDVADSNGNLIIGGSTAGGYFQGVIDSLRWYTRPLTASEILANYNAGNIELQTRVGADASPDDGSWEEWRPVSNETSLLSLDSDQTNWSWDNTATYMPKLKSDESVIKAEGAGSMKLSSGTPQSDSNTVALLHLEENNCFSGYCFFDSSGTGNSAAPTGEVRIVDGFSGKARYFDGNNDYLDIADNASLRPTRITIEAWVKPSLVDSANHVIVNKQRGTSGPVGATYVLSLTSSNKFEFASYDTDWRKATGTTTPIVNQWYHVVGTYDGTNLRVYVNGVQEGSGALAAFNYLGTRPVKIGASEGATIDFGTFEYFVGTIDEIRISNVARSAEEIMEAYRAGRDHRLSRTISASDLSAKTKIPFFLAADRQGTFMEATIGESAYANYEPDANTVGLWHLEENTGSGAYIKDSSSYANNGTPTGTTFTQGKIGKGRRFNGSSDYINVNSSSSITPTNAITVEAWVKPTNFTCAGTDTNCSILSKYGGNYIGYKLETNSSGTPFFNICTPSTCPMASSTIPLIAGQWNYVAATWSPSTIKIYVNGVLSGTGSASTLSQDSTTLSIGKASWYNGDYFNGIIDEVRISNVARTPDEIRQAYEVGRRTHPITIDFKAKLDSGNLISNSSDYSFTVDGTAYGAQTKGSNLYKGDKIVVKENIGGTEYLAQGTVTSIDKDTGAATVASWDSGSTFPSGGFTANATVFKWQREYFDITGSLSTHRDAINRITFRITDGSQGANVWLDDIRSVSSYLTNPSPASNNITSSTGYRYFQYRAILSSNDTAVSPSLTSVTLDYETNSPPNTPTLNSPANGAANQSLTPALKTTATDNNNDYLRYKIQLCTDQAMTQNCQTFDQTVSQTGWSGQNTQSNTAYTSGTQATYTLQTALNPGQTYYWRSYAIDPGGINLWSNTQASPYSFTTSAAPTAPTTPWCEGQSSPVTGVTDLTPEFSAVYTDTDVGDTANFYEIEVGTDDNWDSAEMWDSGQVSMTPTASGARSPDIVYGGIQLSNNITYYWRIRFWDDKGAVGAWSNNQQFTTGLLGTGPFKFEGVKMEGIKIN